MTLTSGINRAGNILIEIIFRLCWFVADTARNANQVNILMGSGYGAFGKFSLLQQWDEEEKARQQSRDKKIRELRGKIKK